MSEFERLVTFSPAYDKRSPDPAKNYGIHGVNLRMVLKGPKGATQFVLFTGWQLPHVTEELWNKNPIPTLRTLSQPLPADLGYHWHKPRYEGQDGRPCEYISTGICYYDGSGLQAERIYKLLLTEGDEAVWTELEKLYRSLEAEDDDQ